MNKRITPELSVLSENTLFESLFKVMEKYHLSARSGKFLDYQSPVELSKTLDLDRPEKTGDWQEILHWVEKYLAYSVKTNHPAFVNRMWVGANLPSIVGEIVAAISNTSACTYESAPVSTLLERYMIKQMLDLVGFSNGEGQMTTGSSNANMIAMMAARNLANASVKQAGLFGQQKLFAFVSEDSHYSMDKAANILGIGIDQLIKVSLNQNGAMETLDLERAIDRVLVNGGLPFFVNATAGTTVRGSYDPVSTILKLRDRYGFWFHVDGAWGGAAVLSTRLREKFIPGLAEVDSFTFDFHKMLGSSLMCNILLINKKTHTLGKVLSAGDGSYLFGEENTNAVEDLGSVSLQCGRRVDSLKWFLDWKYFGRKGFARRIENYLELCEYAESKVNQLAELEMVVARISFNVCFRFKVSRDESDSFNLALRTRLYEQGISLVGVGYINGKLVLRLLISNPAAEKVDIDYFFNNLIEVGKVLLHERSL